MTHRHGTGRCLMLLGTLYWQLMSNKQTKRENSGRFTNQVSTGIMIYSIMSIAKLP